MSLGIHSFEDGFAFAGKGAHSSMPRDDPSTALTAKAINGRVLLVEDDSHLATAVSQYLQASHYNVQIVGSGRLAITEIQKQQTDLAIIDLMLPDCDGTDVCRQMRALNEALPILILSAKDEDFDRVVSLEVGADHYLVKPVAPRVLLAQVNAMIRRGRGAKMVRERPGSTLQFGALTIDPGMRGAFFDGTPVNLSSGEFDLLWLLASNAGQIMPRSRLLAELGISGRVESRSIDSRLCRLRQRFDMFPHVAVYIRSVRPHGYLFVDSEWHVRGNR